ncbi:ArsR/SmtB family transcription factor [Singulisphaera rosea]
MRHPLHRSFTIRRCSHAGYDRGPSYRANPRRGYLGSRGDPSGHLEPDSILWLLDSRERCVTDLWGDLEVDDPSTVSHALAKLKLAGLVEHRQSGKTVIYKPTAFGEEVLRKAKGFMPD